MPESTADKITRLRTLLESGVRSTSVDGVSTTLDLKSIRQELARLEAQAGDKRARRRVYTPHMGRR